MRNFYSKAKFAALVLLLLSGCMSRPSPQVSNNERGNQNVSHTQSSAQSHAGMHGIGNMKGMDHSSMSGMEGMNHSRPGSGAEHDAPLAGKPGSAAQISRTVNVTALDTMRFDPPIVRVQAGETVGFVVTNRGKLPHEFNIGTSQEQTQHAEMMQKMPGMMHQEENAISLAPGETKTLIWQFDQPGTVELACHVPGHYEAGMVGKVIVGSEGK